MPLKPGTILAWLVILVFPGGCGYSSEEELFGVIDGTPPSVAQTLPGQGWILVPTSITVRVWFSEPVDPSSVWLGSIQLISGQDLTSAGYLVGVEEDGRGLVLIAPRDPLIPGVEYVLRITSKVTDLYGNPLDRETLVTFRTIH